MQTERLCGVIATDVNSSIPCAKLLSPVPRDVHPAKLAERSNASTLVFGGSNSGQYMFSNLYKIKGKFGTSHKSSEQAHQHKKARVAGDLNKQREILFNPDTSIQKSLGHKVKGLDEAAWNQQKRNIMKDMITSFTQHEELRKFLLSIYDKKLDDANGKDSYFGRLDFGCCLALTHPDVLKTASRPAIRNQLGEILLEVLQELRLMIRSFNSMISTINIFMPIVHW